MSLPGFWLLPLQAGWPRVHSDVCMLQFLIYNSGIGEARLHRVLENERGTAGRGSTAAVPAVKGTRQQDGWARQQDGWALVPVSPCCHLTCHRPLLLGANSLKGSLVWGWLRACIYPELL